MSEAIENAAIGGISDCGQELRPLSADGSSNEKEGELTYQNQALVQVYNAYVKDTGRIQRCQSVSICQFSNCLSARCASSLLQRLGSKATRHYPCTGLAVKEASLQYQPSAAGIAAGTCSGYVAAALQHRLHSILDIEPDRAFALV